MKRRNKRKGTNYPISVIKRRRAISLLESICINYINDVKLNDCKSKDLFKLVNEKFGLHEDEILADNYSKNSCTNGKIYIIGNLYHRIIKIGFSTNVMKRKKALQTGSHMKLHILALFDGTILDEKKLHKKYKKYKLTGEWFKYEGLLKEALNLESKKS